MTTLVVGGDGFIGWNIFRHWSGVNPGKPITVLHKLTDAGRPENLEGVDNVTLAEGDISDREKVRAAIEGHDVVVNFAAETHVDRSIESPGEFIQTDVYGTYVLLDAAK